MHLIYTLTYNANLPTAPRVPLYYATGYNCSVDIAFFCLEAWLAGILRNPRPLYIDIEYNYSFLAAGEPGYYTGAPASLKIGLYTLPTLGHLM